VRALAARLTRAEREERHRISLVLHDDLQQRLYAMEMRMSMLKAQQDAGNAEAARGHAEEVLGFVDEAINVTRRLSTHLSPPVLEKEGLREALGWLASEMERMYEFTVEIEAVGAEAKGDEAKGDERVTGEDLRILLFQVVRELLFNVVKHAGVDAARVHIRHSADQIGIRVSDDGAGFDPEGLDPNRAAAQDTRAQAEATLEHTEAQATAAFGLADAHKRLQLVGGAMEVESAPGEGTRVTVQAPTSGTAAPEHGSS
jgi:signal transduction histidine kinase